MFLTMKSMLLTTDVGELVGAIVGVNVGDVVGCDRNRDQKLI